MPTATFSTASPLTTRASRIVCVSTHVGPLDGLVRRVAAERAESGGAGVHYAEFPADLDMSGCHYHPSTTDDRRIAAALVEVIAPITSWSPNPLR